MTCCETDKLEVSSANSFFSNLFATLLPYIVANAPKIISWILSLLPQQPTPVLVSLSDSFKAYPSKATFEAFVAGAQKEGAEPARIVAQVVAAYTDSL